MDEYVLPRFDIVCSANPVSVSDKYLTVQCVSKYTFGGDVQGKVTVTVSKPGRIFWEGPGPVILPQNLAAEDVAAVDAAPAKAVAADAAPADAAPVGAAFIPIQPSSGAVKVTKTVDISGTVNIRFDLNDLQASFESYQTSISYTIDADVIEGTTRK